MPMSFEAESPRPGRIRTRQDFARELTLLRERAGLTIRQVAGRVGVRGAHSTIGDWCAGRGLPSPSSRELFVQMLRACGVSDAGLVEQWLQAWLRVRRMPGRRAAGPEPYRGLASFQPDDAEWFFGRQALTEELAGRLADLDAADGGVQVVVGPSGSGKSSLLRAGLIPALADGKVPGSARWPVVLLTPGPSPVEALAAGLATVMGVSAAEVAAAVRVDPARGMRAVASTVGHGRLTVVVDQFEEVFAPDTDDEERQPFIAALLAAACGPGGTLVVLGLRADFYAQVLRDPQLAATVRRQFVVGPMNEAELQEVIVEPARKARLDLEDGLVELLLREVAPRSRTGPAAHDAGVLPLLSHALYATWDHGQHRRLTIADYRAAGGIDGAVAATASTVYDGLAPAQCELARRLFVSLVHVAPDVVDTRRRATTAELRAWCGEDQAAQLDEVLDQFIAARLITTDADGVEMSHEALLTAWPQLRAWVDTDRAGLVIGRQLRDAAQSWQHEGRDPVALYRGTKLAAAEEWAADHRLEQPPLVLDFLAASASRQAHKQRETQRRVRRRYQFALALVTAFALIVAGVAAYTNQLKLTAEHSRVQALSRLVAGEADQLRGHDVSLSVQLALAAYRIAPTTQARSSLLNSTAVPAATQVRGPGGMEESAAVGDGGRLLAVGTDSGRVQLWTVGTDGRVHQAGAPLTEPAGPIVSLAFSPGGHTLAAGDADRKVYLWNISNPGRPRALGTLTGSRNKILSVAVSSDGRTLAAGGVDRKVYLWNISNPGHAAPEAELTGPAQAVTAVAFTPNGDTLAAGSQDATVHLWNVTDPAHPAALTTLTGPRSQIFSIAISHDGRHLAAGTAAQRDIYLWDISDPAHPASLGPPLAGSASWINAVAFSPDGTTLAAGSSDTQVWLFDLKTRRLIGQLPHPAPVTTTIYRNDRSLVTVAADGILRIWNLPGPVITGAKDTVYTVSFDANGHELGINPGANDNTLTVWNPADIQHPVQDGPALVNSPAVAKFPERAH